MDEFAVVEADVFKGFCKKMKVKNIQEYEQMINGGSATDATTFDKKCELEQVISKNENQVAIIESHMAFKQIEAIKQSLAQEEERLKALTMQDGVDNLINPLGNLIESAESIQKKQEELKELELLQDELDKEKSGKVGRQQKLKEDLTKFSARVDGLLRNQNLNKMQLRNIKNQIR
jgi:hypothetical protein